MLDYFNFPVPGNVLEAYQLTESCIPHKRVFYLGFIDGFLFGSAIDWKNPGLQPYYDDGFQRGQAAKYKAA
jgi:hypothetical protein